MPRPIGCGKRLALCWLQDDRQIAMELANPEPLNQPCRRGCYAVSCHEFIEKNTKPERLGSKATPAAANFVDERMANGRMSWFRYHQSPAHQRIYRLIHKPQKINTIIAIVIEPE